MHTTEKQPAHNRALTGAELDEVSGGVVAVERQKKHITKFKFEPTSFEFGLSHSNEL